MNGLRKRRGPGQPVPGELAPPPAPEKASAARSPFRAADGPTRPPRGDAQSPSFLLGFRRALYRGAGYSRDEVRRPLIGVANSWGEISPATKHLNRLTERVKAGISEAGGTPVEFVLSGLCDGTCAAAPGFNRYNLPWRDIAASYIEAVARANMFDGLVLVGVCDEVVPAHLLAALRVDLPGLLVLGGSMEPGRSPLHDDPVWAGEMTSAYAGLQDGSVSQAQYEALEASCCTGGGACGVMGTAVTMQVFAEAAGLALPGSATAPGGGLELEQLALEAGRLAVALVEQDLRPSAVLTQGALENAVRATVAVGGSTCAVLHALALADEAGLRLELDDFDRLSRATPWLVDVLPSGRVAVTDYHRAGGVPATLRALAPLLHRQAPTVSARTLEEQLAGVPAGNPRVIRPLDDPLAAEGAFAILRGTLAPGGAVFKQSGSGVRAFRGPARVFADEEAAGEAILAGEIEGGEVLVVRGSGPKGAPGMPCLYGSVWLLKSLGLDDRVALITDGRLSGTIRGLALAHLSPEAGEPGPLAVVRDGDEIVIDVEARRVDLLLPEGELEARVASCRPAAGDAGRGALAQYRALVGPAEEGAVLRAR